MTLRSFLLRTLCLLVFASPARANPVPGSVVDAMNYLPSIMLGLPTAVDEARFVRFLAQYGVDQPALYKAETRALFVEQYEKLKPYFFRSQGNGGLPQASVQDLVRVHGSKEDRIQMCRMLRQWLELPDDSLRSANEIYVIVPGSRRKYRQVLSWSRCQAAEFLADWDDTEAGRLIDRLLSRPHDDVSPRDRDEVRWFLRQAARRLAHSDSAFFLTVDSTGAVSSHRSLAGVVSASVGLPTDLNSGKGERIHTDSARRIWQALSHHVSGRRSEPLSSPRGVRLEFQDGFHATFHSLDGDLVAYSDNSRLRNPSLTLESDALHAVISELSQGE